MPRILEPFAGCKVPGEPVRVVGATNSPANKGMRHTTSNNCWRARDSKADGLACLSQVSSEISNRSPLERSSPR
jgi:hypothetical protein